MKEPTFLFGLLIAGTTLILIVRTIASAFTRGRSSNSELADLKEQLDEVQQVSADQAAQLADVQNRLDFAERLLARARERSALDPPSPEGRGGQGVRTGDKDK